MKHEAFNSKPAFNLSQFMASVNMLRSDVDKVVKKRMGKLSRNPQKAAFVGFAASAYAMTSATMEGFYLSVTAQDISAEDVTEIMDTVRKTHTDFFDELEAELKQHVALNGLRTEVK